MVRALLTLAASIVCSAIGSAGDRHPLAPQGLPRLLAMALEARPGSTSDFGGNEGPNRPNGEREWLASAEGPSRAIEAGDPPRTDDHLAVLMPRVDAGADPHQRWMTFLRNHRDVIPGMDFFVVPTVRFTLLYVWFVLDHGRRRVLCVVKIRPRAQAASRQAYLP